MNYSRQYDLRSALPTLLPILLFGFGLTMVSPGLALASKTDVYGGLGGTLFEAECPKGSYLVGLSGRTGAWVDRIAPACAPWLRGSQTFGAPTIGQSFGMSGGGQEQQTRCTGGNTFAVQSWIITLLKSDNHYVQFIQGYCVSLIPSSTYGGLLFGQKTPDVDTSTLGPFESKPPGQACPAGEAAVGIRVRAGKFVDAVGLICGPVPAGLGAPVTKVDPRLVTPRVPSGDMFVVVKPGAGEKIPHGQLVVTATPPKVGMTNVTELELRYLDAPANQQHSYPSTTIVYVDTLKLLQGYSVAERVTGGYVGRWQVRARSSMKAVSGSWSFPVQFHMVKAQPPPPMVQMPKANAPITQTPAPGTGAATQMVRPPTTSSGSAARSLMVRPRGVEEKAGEASAEPEKKP